MLIVVLELGSVITIVVVPTSLLIISENEKYTKILIIITIAAV